MKINWKETTGTKLIELYFNLAEKKKTKIPKLKGSIVKLNFIITKEQYHSGIIDSKLEKLKKLNPLIIFIGNIKILHTKNKDEKRLDLKLSRMELINEFIDANASKEIKENIRAVAIEMIEDEE